MGFSKNEPRMDVVGSSGMLRVTFHAKPHWFVLLVDLTVIVTITAVIRSSWSKMPIVFRAIFIRGVISAVLTLIYQLSATQLIEFD